MSNQNNEPNQENQGKEQFYSSNESAHNHQAHDPNMGQAYQSQMGNNQSYYQNGSYQGKSGFFYSNGTSAMPNKSGNWQNSLSTHIIMVVIVSLVLLIPAMFFDLVLSDRQYTEDSAVRSIVEPWGESQSFSDPLLVVPITKKVQHRNDDGDYSYKKKSDEVFATPYYTQSSFSLDFQKRFRGNYGAVLYKTTIKQRGVIDLNNALATLKSSNPNSEFSLNNDFLLLFNVRINKGIEDVSEDFINGKAYAVEPNSNYSGFVVRIPSRDIKAIYNGQPLSGGPSLSMQEPNRGDGFYGEFTEEASRKDLPDLYNHVDADKDKANQDNDTVAVLAKSQRSFYDTNKSNGNMSGVIRGDGVYWDDDATYLGRSDSSARKRGGNVVAQDNDEAVDVKAKDRTLANHSAEQIYIFDSNGRIKKGLIVFEASYVVRGSQSLMYRPLAKLSEFNILGSWTTPSYTGDYLPNEHTTETVEGVEQFAALYRQNNLATGVGAFIDSSDATFGKYKIDFSGASEHYTLVDRLTKYVLLFIAMTFVTVLAFEIISKRMVTLAQYMVIGAALILFYMVLLSLSEYIGFTIAYVIAALLMSSMIGLYLKAVLGSVRNAFAVFCMLLAMYAVLFAIVHIEAYALLVGTFLLVIMLGIVMFITRRLNAQV